MPETMGDVAASMIREKFPNQQIAMLSCDLTRDAVKQSLRAGAVDFIEKSSAPEEILNRVQLYCERYEALLKTIRKANTRSKSENQKLIESIGLIGQSTEMAELALKVQKLAAVSDVSVLIRGESGTGKERIARALHDLSSRRAKPFVAINCAAIPRELLESELFGHKKGAFTGAINDREGKFFAANGGTIFLDEIGDMPMELQSKLLRVLQERFVEPVGSTIAKKIDVRILSATHKNLQILVANGSFRADLMFRLNAVEVAIPALRERLDDIEPLVEHFTEAFNRKYGTSKYFQRRTLEILRRYPWPGNVRELDNVVEKHLVECDDEVAPEDIDLSLHQTSEVVPSETKLSEFEQLQQKDKMVFIQKTIQQVGTKAEAARRLGIKPTHLQYILNSAASKS
jgi:DNA-binding NtrC family response regulator